MGCELLTTTIKYRAALSRFDLVPIETGGCSCLALVPAASGTSGEQGSRGWGRQGTAQASVLLLHFHVSCVPLCFLTPLLLFCEAMLSPTRAQCTLQPCRALQTPWDPGLDVLLVLCGTTGLDLFAKDHHWRSLET